MEARLDPIQRAVLEAVSAPRTEEACLGGCGRLVSCMGGRLGFCADCIDAVRREAQGRLFCMWFPGRKGC